MQCDLDIPLQRLHNTTTSLNYDPSDVICLYPAYFVHVVYLVLLGVCSLVHIEHVTKMAVEVLATAVFSALYMSRLGVMFDFYDKLMNKT